MPAPGSFSPSSGPAPAAWPLWPLPLACAVLFLVAIHGSLLIGIATGGLGACFPYGPDCHSISATGRALPAKLLFKPALTVAAAGLVLYWGLMVRWLRLQGVEGERPQRIGGLGVAGALCLIAYTAALGEGGDSAFLLRRLGAVLGFSLNFLAQLLLTDSLQRLVRDRQTDGSGERGLAPEWSGALIAWLRRLVLLLLALGLASALLAPFPWHERIDDGIEWWLALLLNLHVALTALLWRRSDFRS